MKLTIEEQIMFVIASYEGSYICEDLAEEIAIKITDDVLS